MVSDSVAFGSPDSGAGIMDGSVIGTLQIGKESDRNSPFGADRVGQTLSQHQASAFGQQQLAQEAEKEVALGQLWFELPDDERAQFGSCFTRMLLKCLSDTEHNEQEV
jgi:hypothetical protein